MRDIPYDGRDCNEEISINPFNPDVVTLTSDDLGVVTLTPDDSDVVTLNPDDSIVTIPIGDLVLLTSPDGDFFGYAVNSLSSYTSV